LPSTVFASFHSAQIGRRLAERLLKDCKDEVEAWGGLDPDMVETAALAHDLGDCATR